MFLILHPAGPAKWGVCHALEAPVSDWTPVLLLSPIILMILGAVAVIIVALCRATPADVPTVMNTACSILCRLADRLPPSRRSHGTLDSRQEQGEAGSVSIGEADR